jgi:uncharacterized protein YkwD
MMPFWWIVFCFALLSIHPAELPARSPETASETQGGEPDQESGWNLSRLDTARTIAYLSDLEKQVVLELNKVRSDPSRYARSFLIPQRKYYAGQELTYPGEIPIRTREGIHAFEECNQVLVKTRSMGILTPQAGLARAARDHVLDQSKTGQIGHEGRDHSKVSGRANRYGRWTGKIGETIQYGHAAAARIVSSLLIDDGVPSRGHREIILEPLFRNAGVAFGPHPKFRNMCVIVFAVEYADSGTKASP